MGDMALSTDLSKAHRAGLVGDAPHGAAVFPLALRQSLFPLSLQ